MRIFIDTLRYKMFFVKFIVYSFILICFLQPNTFAFGKNIPSKVNEYGENYSLLNKKPVKIIYIMKWKNYNVYRLSFVEKGVSYRGLPIYVLYDNKEVRRPTKEENSVLQLDAKRHSNKILSKKYKELEKKLSHNINKTMNLIDNTQPPEIPTAITKYADKYMLKGDDRSFLYLMDWNGQHVYRTCWQRYPFHLHPSAIILYDGEIVRRPTKQEYNEMHSEMQKALFKQLNAQRYQYNKD